MDMHIIAPGRGRARMAARTRRTRRTAGALALALAAVQALPPAPARADGTDLLAGLFDAVTGVPFATVMLGIVRQGATSASSPDVLGQWLVEVAQLLVQFDGRLRQLEQRVDQLQVEAIKAQNLARLREYQRLHDAIALINTELRTRPADPGRRAVLAAGAQQIADSMRDTPGFDLWMWTDLDARTNLLRTRFHVTPSFELYSLAVATWISTLAFLYPDRPQALIAAAGPALRAHADFLRTRPGWRDQWQPPERLPEYLESAVFCRPGALDTYADRDGACRFVTECVDGIDDKLATGAQFTLDIGRPTPGGSALCVWDADRAWDFPEQQALRDGHGEALMTALAATLDKLATSGSLAEPFVGTFPDWILSPVYAAPLDQPLQAPPAAAPGAAPMIAGCTLGLGCQLPATGEAAWQIGSSSGVHTVRNHANGLCLDVQGNAPAAGAGLALWTCNGTPTQNWERRATSVQGKWTLALAGTNWCLTVPDDPPNPPPGSIGFRVRTLFPRRPVLLQACGGNPRQVFATQSESQPVRGPN